MGPVTVPGHRPLEDATQDREELRGAGRADHAGAGVFVELFDESEQAPVDTDPLGGVTGVDFL